jgi:hypothetical protein
MLDSGRMADSRCRLGLVDNAGIAMIKGIGAIKAAYV